jgi:hypothetical protein
MNVSPPDGLLLSPDGSVKELQRFPTRSKRPTDIEPRWAIAATQGLAARGP